jgi:hypothetical protein
MRSAEKFAADNDLNDILPLLKKGALAAQNPAEVATMDDFTDEEKEIFQEELTHKWRQPKILYITIILNSVAGMHVSLLLISRILTPRQLPSKDGIKLVPTERTCLFLQHSVSLRVVPSAKLLALALPINGLSVSSILAPTLPSSFSLAGSLTLSITGSVVAVSSSLLLSSLFSLQSVWQSHRTGNNSSCVVSFLASAWA